MSKILVDASRPVVAPNPVTSSSAATKTLEQAIQEATEQARAACEIKGNASSDCAVAWDIVEELQAEKSHRRQGVEKSKTSLEQYCDQHPDATECLVYDL